MARLLPSTPDLSGADDAEPRVIGVETDDADDLISALSSGTAREMLNELHHTPATPSEIADTIDTSLQNTQYHLEKLRAADVVEVIDTVYSEKGREMKVYAPTDDPLVVVAGSDTDTASLKTALTSLLGGVAVLAGLTAAIHFAITRSDLIGGQPNRQDAGVMTAETTQTAASQPGLLGGLEPALASSLLFFAGGLVVLLVGVTVWYAAYSE